MRKVPVVKDFNIRRLPASFRYAARGIWHVLRTEQNAQFHFLATIVAVTLSLVFEISAVEFALILLAIGFVIVSEVVNTIIEDFLDVIHPQHHQAVRRIKDALAGAVLLAAIIAVSVAILVFGPYFVAAIE